MANTVSVTSRIPTEVCERLDRLAETTDRSRAWLINKALEQYLDEVEQDVAGTLEGIQAADGGEIVSGEEVGRMLQELIAANKVA